MPTYVYRCAKCGEQLEAFQSFADTPLTKHSDCGGKLTKVLSAAGIVLKGSGFYKTDNRASKGTSKERTKESAASSSESSSGSDASSSGADASSSGSKSSDSGSGPSKPSTESSSSSSSGSEAKSA